MPGADLLQAKILEVGEEKQNIKQIEADLAAVNSEDVQKTGSKDGSRKRQYFSSEALRIEAESHYPVAHHTVHLRDQDQDDTVSTKRVDDFTWRMSVMPASGRFG